MQENKVEKIEEINSRQTAQVSLPQARNQVNHTALHTAKPKKERKNQDTLALGKHKAEDEFAGYTRFNPPTLNHNKPAEKKAKNWTILTYLAADCNLEECMVSDVIDMEKVGSSKNMNIVVQIDRGADKAASVKKHGGMEGAARYYIQKNPRAVTNPFEGYTRYNPPTFPLTRMPNQIYSKPQAVMGQVNTADPKVLEDFVTWGMKEYPAKNYLILAYGHGSGATGLVTDDGSENHGPIALPDFNKAIMNAEKAAGVDKSQVLLGMKSCLMGQMETAYELKDAGAGLLDSQSVIHADSWRMDDILGKPGTEDKGLEEMAANIFMENRIAKIRINNDGEPEYRNAITTGSVVDLDKMTPLKDALVNFKEALQKTNADPAVLKAVLEIGSRPGFFENTEITYTTSDLAMIAGVTAQNPKIQDNNVKLASMLLLQALHNAMPLSSQRADHEHKNSIGMGLVTASKPETYKNAGYEKLALEKDTGWSEFMSNYAPEVTAEDMDKRLNGTRVTDFRLTPVAQSAQKSLKNWNQVSREIDSAMKEIKRINQDKTHTEHENLRKSIDVMLKISAMKDLNETLTSATKVDPKHWEFKVQNGQRVPTAKINESKLTMVAFQGYQEVLGNYLRNMLQKSSSYPQYMPAYLRSGLEVISALDGEFSSASMAQASRNLMKARQEMQEGLPPAAKAAVTRLLKEPDMKKKAEMQKAVEEKYPEAIVPGVMLSSGQEMLTVMGYATRNSKIINQKNYSGNDRIGYLEAISKFKNPPQQVMAGGKKANLTETSGK